MAPSAAAATLRLWLDLFEDLDIVLAHARTLERDRRAISQDQSQITTTRFPYQHHALEKWFGQFTIAIQVRYPLGCKVI